jgi:hypothetical protein
MERQHYTFIVKISNGVNKLPRGYVIDNASQDLGYFEGFHVLEEFILAHLKAKPNDKGNPECGINV